MSESARPSYLFVLSSTNQMLSGTGKAIFDWIKFAKSEFSFAILIDALVPENFNAARTFCDEESVRLYVSTSDRKAGAPDVGPDAIIDVLASEHWRYIEIVSWANASTNINVLAARGPNSVIVYTPHTQPMSTLGREWFRYFLVEPAFEMAIQSADLVCCDSHEEMKLLQERFPQVRSLRHIPLGVDDSVFHPDDVPRKHQVVSVLDFAEPRKRADLLFAAFAELVRSDQTVKIVIAGPRSDKVPLPTELRGRVEARGYLSLSELVHLYRSSKAFALLSDFEAFGLPIAEALACGTPAVINGTPELLTIFGGLEGVAFVDNRDRIGSAAALASAIGNAPSPAIAGAAKARFGRAASYGLKLSELLSLS